MTTSEMTKLIDAQRYLIAALFVSTSYIEDEAVKSIARVDAEKLWETTEYMGEVFNIKLKSFEDIVNHANEIVALNKMYDLSHDKDKVN